MAFDYHWKHAHSGHGDIIPTAIIIKNIPIQCETDRFLDLMRQMKLPSPSALSFLYNGSHVFRGMAFANFASADECQQVLQGLNYLSVCGGRLNVQFKRKHPHTIAREKASRRNSIQPDHHSSLQDSETADAHQSAKASATPRSMREKTPPSESYDLLMSYQTNPVEKDKLRRFFAQTGDYQEAVDGFAKNRARERLAGEHGRSIDDWPILEMRPPTLGEEQQIAEMESRLGFGGEASSSRSHVIKRERKQNVPNVTKGELLWRNDQTPIGVEHEAISTAHRVEVDEGNNGNDVENNRVRADSEELEGADTGPKEKR